MPSVKAPLIPVHRVALDPPLVSSARCVRPRPLTSLTSGVDPVAGWLRLAPLGPVASPVAVDSNRASARRSILRVSWASASSAPRCSGICLTALKLRQQQREEAEAAAGKAWHETGLVLTTRYGTPIEPRNFQRSWQTRCEKAGVTPITVHDARRTCATLLADLDVHPRVAMQVLRHARFAVTMEIYTQVTSTKTRDALKRLGESLSR
ncbi:tyrosine-type recombinase/integrase [Micromonospora maritima]|uniref:tyrosine-type recombinase/integrase n=1 Tax=Micromonospora maritima TaxID=986711 RepID=UPI001FE61332